MLCHRACYGRPEWYISLGEQGTEHTWWKFKHNGVQTEFINTTFDPAFEINRPTCFYFAHCTSGIAPTMEVILQNQRKQDIVLDSKFEMRKLTYLETSIDFPQKKLPYVLRILAPQPVSEHIGHETCSYSREC